MVGHDPIVTVEAMLVGALAQWPASWDDLPHTLVEGYFSDPGLAAAFRVIRQRVEAGERIMPELVAAELSPEHADTLAEACAIVATAANVAHHAHAVLENGVRGRLTTYLSRAAQQAAAGNLGATEAIRSMEGAAAKAQEILAGCEDVVGVTGGDGVCAVMLAAEASQRGDMVGIQTRIPSVDRMTGGLIRGQVWVVGSRPSAGKSTLGGQMAMVSAEIGRYAVIATYEMSTVQFWRRIVSARSGINAMDVRDGNLTASQWTQLNAVGQDVMTAFGDRLAVIDRLPRDHHALMATARRLKRKGKLDVLIVDYLQKLNAGFGFRGNRNQELETIIGDLAAMARELDITVVAMSQLKRTNDADEPTLSSLRDSGAIEGDADVILFLWRDEPDDHAKRGMSVGKARDGMIGRFAVRLDTDRMMFNEESAPVGMAQSYYNRTNREVQS